MRGQKRRNVFYDNQGFPDQSHDFDVLLRNVDGGTVLRKRKHPAPALDEIAPEFYAKYDESLHGAKLRKELDLSHLLARVRDKVYGLIQIYWSVFDDKGQFVPVKDYTCIIDTGSARLIAVKKIHYGPREIPIMRQCIANLAKLNYCWGLYNCLDGYSKYLKENSFLFSRLKTLLCFHQRTCEYARKIAPSGRYLEVV